MSMRTTVMLNDVTSAVTGPVLDVQNYQNTEYGLLQVTISGTATAVLEGRVSSSMGWQVIDTFTATDASRVSPFPHMRVRVSSYSSGTIRAEMAV